ncbi:MAG: fumarylacetoacetate hydrolase family protein [Neptuniibacter sp.]
MIKEEINFLGDELYRALRNQRPLPPLTERVPNITLKDAYQVSLRMVNRRVEEDGEVIIGKKIGITSEVVQRMFNVDQPDFGFLTDKMSYPNGAHIPVEGHLIAPKAEGEIGFRLKKDLVGPGVTEADVLDATESIMPCFEVVDSRIQDWKIKIEDTVADNASCGVFVLGQNEVDPREIDLPDLRMRVYKNGELISEGKGSAVQGNPLSAVAWLANTLGEFGIPFNAGDVILSGSLVPLEPVSAGDEIHLELDGIGTASCSFV